MEENIIETGGMGTDGYDGNDKIRASERRRECTMCMGKDKGIGSVHS